MPSEPSFSLGWEGGGSTPVGVVEGEVAADWSSITVSRNVADGTISLWAFFVLTNWPVLFIRFANHPAETKMRSQKARQSLSLETIGLTWISF